ncbi:MAG TPA: aldehyde dehydrogenase family protein [Myxococcales bacterium]|jgi:acyl-CoA reductase-like NAD-dependent aldehyde dehydrogenase|nr:aldehyde dehydrogenase family protein [Myxococcales bacterium]
MAEAIPMPQKPAPLATAQGAVTPQGTLAVFEPGNGKLLGEVRVSTAKDVREAVQAARRAQADWARKTFAQRRDVLLRFRDLLLARATEFCEHLTRENGKTRNESLFMEVLPVADATTWYANHARKALQDEKIPLHMFPHKKSYLRFYPRGVVGIISPWNYPFSIPTGDAVGALMAGNAVVVKPSEFTPIILEKTRALLEEAGLPRGLFGVVQGRGDVGAELIRSGVNMIIFTGSVATGKKVNVAAAEQMIPCVLELGGKDPAIVLPDADLDSAAKKIAWGAFANSGQTCASVERVYVHESVAQSFTDKVVKLAKGLRQGEPNAHDVDVGAMTTQMQVEIVRRHLDEARARGAKVLAGGEVKVTPEGARFVQPTVLTGTTPDMAIVRDETFGPMLPIMTYRTEEEVVRLANDSLYGLSAYVFTKDKSAADRIANQLLAGTVMHNDTLYTHAAPETPWGGVKSSGLGRVHGKHGMRDFCEVRHVNLERLNFPAFWYYPYSRKAWNTGLRVYRTLLGRGIAGRIKALFGLQ